MTAIPRVDQLRRQIEGTGRLLNTTAKGVHTLHELAYDRQVADQVRVAGGQPDYALDRHGDPNARAAYKQLALTVDSCCEQLAEAARNAVRILNTGDSVGLNRQHPASITVQEHAEAIEAQARRAKRGEFDAGRTHPQPGLLLAERQLATQVDALRRVQDQLAAAIAGAAEQIDKALTDPIDQARRRRRIRAIQRRLLNTLETLGS